MSNNCWERGTLTLPSAATPIVKKALRDNANSHHKAVLDLCKQTWTGPLGKTRSGKIYTERLEAWMTSIYDARSRAARSYSYYSSTAADAAQATQEAQDAAYQVLQNICCPSRSRVAGAAFSGTPHQATVADVDKVAPRATNRTDSFNVGSEAHIFFKGREVTWAVPENNHADEHAHAEPVAHVFFDALAKVTWTRGTGGTIWGNSEYNENPHGGYGRGPDFARMSFGPLGDNEQVFGYINSGFTKAQARKLVTTKKASALTGYR